MTRPMMINTEGWASFDPASATDAMCERERHAFTHYMIKRMNKQQKTGSDDQAILVGAVMAIVQMAFAMNGNDPTDTTRGALHDALDYAWLQCVGMLADSEGLN